MYDKIEKSNNDTIKLFNDNKNILPLINIYINNPESFEILYSYIQNTNESSNNLPKLNEENISANELNKLITFILENNINSNINVIKHTLLKNSLHLNLTIRDLINQK